MLNLNLKLRRRIDLKNEHLSAQHGNGVEVPLADIGPIVVGSVGGPGAGGILGWSGFWAASRHGGQRLSGNAVGLTFRESQRGVS